MPKKSIKRARSVQSVGIVIKRDTPLASAFALRIAKWLRSRVKEICIEENRGVSEKEILKLTASGSARIRLATKRQMVRSIDLVVVLGGDGTLIRMAREVLGSRRRIPLMGVNMGSLGFLTNIPKGDLTSLLSDVLAGRHRETPRGCLEILVTQNGRPKPSVFVLNDVVVSKADVARMVELKVAIDGRFIATFRADGIIVATPTGSTAYSVAAGGPIVSPQLAGTVITPICPQFFGHRSLVVPDRCEIELTPGERNPSKIFLSFDGQTGYEIDQSNGIKIRRAESEIFLVEPAEWDFFETLREKLKWSVRSHAQGSES